MSLIATKNLIKFFGKNAALRGLTLRVPKGVSGLIGPNGSGKTTMINILLGLLKPDSGEAHVFGSDCWSESYEIRCRVGVLRENPKYPGGFTGERYLELAARIHGIAQPRSKAIDILREVGLYEARSRLIKGYSAGMLQRLGLAQALIGDPELVILDEPTANLDPSGRISLLEKVMELHSDRSTNFFISSHILPELEKVCKWASIIKGGVIIVQGFMSDLAEKYPADTYKIEISDPKLFATKMEELSAVEKVWVDDNVVYCRVRIVSDFYREVPRLASEFGLSLRRLQPVHSVLEKVYRRVVENKRED